MQNEKVKFKNKKPIQIWTDGGARGNPGPAAVGVVVKEAGRTIYETARSIGQATNNQAEYQAIIIALDWLRSQKINADNSEITCHLDSELVVKQLRGDYKVKHAHMKPLHGQVRELLSSVGPINFSVVPRSQNKRADQLVNEALNNLPRIKRQLNQFHES